MNTHIKVGDAVLNLANGCKMSVHKITDTHVQCHWLNDSGIWRLDEFTYDQISML